MAAVPNTKSLKDVFIINAGCPRTGTTSMCDALKQLGFKCYHMDQILQTEGSCHQLKWIKLGAEKIQLKKSKNISSFDRWNEIQIEYDWNKIFESTADGIPYNACTDAPCFGFYQEIMKFYPNHKVILSVRDSAELWYESTINSIYYYSRYYVGHLYYYLFDRFMYHHQKLCINTEWNLVFDDKFEDKQYTQKKYNEWNQSVIDYVDKDKLLLFNAKHDSWSKLCKFLEIKHIPKGSFPHSNERKVWQTMSNEIKLKAYGFNLVLVGLTVIGGILAVKWYKNKSKQS